MGKSTEDLIRDLETSGILNSPESHPAVKTDAGVASRPDAPPSSSSVVLLIVAAVLAAVIGSLPFGSYALYPFSLFVTLIHESAHALAAVATGGSVGSLGISANLSGVTMTSGGAEAVIAPAGYVGASLAGAALLATPIRYARWLVGAAALVPLSALMFFHPASAFTALWSVVFIVGLGLAAWRLGARALGFLQIFLGVVVALNAFRDVTWLMFASGPGSHMESDATNMAHATVFPPYVWATIFTLVSLLLLAGSLAVVVRRDFPGVKKYLPKRRRAARAESSA